MTEAAVREILEQDAYDRGYAQARADIRRAREERKRKAEQQRAEALEELKYFVTQKAIGLVMAVIGVVTVPVLDYDATAALIIVPLGLYLVFTKCHVMDLYGHETDIER